MQLTAKLIQLLLIQTGTGKNGQWKKQDIIVETDGQYSKKVCISVWGDKINSTQLQANKLLKIDFKIESREYNGKWFTDLKAWKIDVVDSNSLPAENNVISIIPSADEDDILPF